MREWESDDALRDFLGERNAKLFRFTTSVLYEQGGSKRLCRSLFVSMPCSCQKTPSVRISMILSANGRPACFLSGNNVMFSNSMTLLIFCLRVSYIVFDRLIPSRAFQVRLLVL